MEVQVLLTVSSRAETQILLDFNGHEPSSSAEAGRPPLMDSLLTLGPVTAVGPFVKNYTSHRLFLPGRVPWQPVAAARDRGCVRCLSDGLPPPQRCADGDWPLEAFSERSLMSNSRADRGSVDPLEMR
ncbi:hypothetical protein COCON_G00106950 [Conger conger]|uniref:Uncharacterized protein n=1 Tax=Conger conger TaxID=82655 RepID=A0A9Q1DIZ9_CONCO|nr:hypothetical protein COCON_G00106950 [Conger conger]